MNTATRTLLIATTLATASFTLGCAETELDAEFELELDADIDPETEVETATELSIGGLSTRELATDELLLELPFTTSLDAVPSDLRRRAAFHLEAMRANENGNPNASFSGLVFAFERPDIDGPAYFEFELRDGEEIAGSILLSTGAHDFPVAGMSSTGESIARGLVTDAFEAEATPARLFKLDALSYVVETEEGTIGAQIGALPQRPLGLEMAMIDEPMPASEEVIPAVGSEDEPNPEPEIIKTGAEGSPVTLEPFAGWDNLEAEYGDALAVELEALRRDAEDQWSIEELAQAYGEGIGIGAPTRVPLLAEDTQFSIEGEGAELVEALVWPGVDGPVLELSALAVPAEPVAFTVVLDHQDLEDEVLTYFVSAQEPQPQPDAAEPQFYSSWTPWRYHWAGTRSEQRLYNQYKKPNGCWIGCGGVAWAMLFGWADQRAAAGNSYWAPRWGIYRQNAGVAPTADATAPRTVDAGVRNMVDEIAQHIGTFCIDLPIFGVHKVGATMHWDMHKAYRYLEPRTGTRLRADYNVLSIPEDRLRNRVISSLQRAPAERTPVVIGTGFISSGHYPLAWGYAERTRQVQSCFLWWCDEVTEYQRWFYVNQGWGGRMDWVEAKTWFAGEIFPH